MRISAYFKLLRPRQFLKQSVVLLPMVASVGNWSLVELIYSLMAVLAFAFASGFVYVVNDLADLETDQKDSTKSQRPHAAGMINSKNMKYAGSVFLVFAIVLTSGFKENTLHMTAVLITYCLINLAYSHFHLKELKIVGLALVSLGFPLRFVFGSLALDLPLSPWGFTLLFQLSVFMLAGKRFQTAKRKKFIDSDFTPNYELDYWLLSLVSFGSLFTATYVGFTMSENNQAFWGLGPLLLSTIPLGLGILRYLEIVTHPDLFIESDATESFIGDKMIICLALIFCSILAFGKFTSA
jgi:decaprenyl-phosphate phosphoribosyltransferase